MSKLYQAEGKGLDVTSARTALYDHLRRVAKEGNVVVPENPVTAGREFVVALREDRKAYVPGPAQKTIEEAYQAALRTAGITTKDVDGERYRVRITGSFELRPAGASGAGPSMRGQRDISDVIA